MSEALEVVETLNGIIFDRYGDQERSLFTYITDGYVEAIEFDGCVIWCSEADGREYNEDGTSETPLFNTVSNLYHKWYFDLPTPHVFTEYQTN